MSVERMNYAAEHTIQLTKGLLDGYLRHSKVYNKEMKRMDKMQNYSDLFFFFRLDNDCFCVHRFMSYALVYVHSGTLEMTSQGQTVTIETGEAGFVSKEICLCLSVCRKETAKAEVAMLCIPESFLREFYFTIDKQESIIDTPDRSMFLIPPRKDIDSLFCSMIPYYGTNVVPGEKILKLKIIEAIYALLETDRFFYTLLFGFAQGGKINVFDLLADTCNLPFHWHKNKKFRIEPDNQAN